MPQANINSRIIVRYKNNSFTTLNFSRLNDGRINIFCCTFGPDGYYRPDLSHDVKVPNWREVDQQIMDAQDKVNDGWVTKVEIHNWTI